MQYNPIECGKRIRYLRKINDINQTELASQLNIHSASLSAIENGHRSASIDLLIDIAEYLHASLDYLILGKENLLSQTLSTELQQMSAHIKNMEIILQQNRLDP